MPSSTLSIKSNPHNPESFRRSTISSTARDIPGCEITRTIVAGPVAGRLLEDFYVDRRKHLPPPASHGSIGGPAGNKALYTYHRCVRRRHRTTSVGSRLRASRFNVRRTLGGAESLRKARSASLRLFTTATPLPDQLPSDFSTAGKPIVSRHASKVVAVTATVGGAGILSSRAREPIP